MGEFSFIGLFFQLMCALYSLPWPWDGILGHTPPASFTFPASFLAMLHLWNVSPQNCRVFSRPTGNQAQLSAPPSGWISWSAEHEPTTPASGSDGRTCKQNGFSLFSTSGRRTINFKQTAYTLWCQLTCECSCQTWACGSVLQFRCGPNHRIVPTGSSSSRSSWSPLQGSSWTAEAETLTATCKIKRLTRKDHETGNTFVEMSATKKVSTNTLWTYIRFCTILQSPKHLSVSCAQPRCSTISNMALISLPADWVM